MSGHSWSRIPNSKWKVRPPQRMSPTYLLPCLLPTHPVSESKVTALGMLSERRWIKLIHRGVTITAPKVKIVACKSGDATDGKKPKQWDRVAAQDEGKGSGWGQVVETKGEKGWWRARPCLRRIVVRFTWHHDIIVLLKHVMAYRFIWNSHPDIRILYCGKRKTSIYSRTVSSQLLIQSIHKDTRHGDRSGYKNKKRWD